MTHSHRQLGHTPPLGKGDVLTEHWFPRRTISEYNPVISSTLYLVDLGGFAMQLLINSESEQKHNLLK